MSQLGKIDLTAPVTGRIVEWNREKRYGFLQYGRVRVFLHLRDFAEHHKRPAIGDEIAFVLGQDAQGRTCAQQAVHVNDGGRITLLTLIVLAGLLALPVIALWRWRVDWRWAGGIGLTLTALAYLTYSDDKRRARAKQWRIWRSPHPTRDAGLIRLITFRRLWLPPTGPAPRSCRWLLFRRCCGRWRSGYGRRPLGSSAVHCWNFSSFLCLWLRKTSLPCSPQAAICVLPNPGLRLDNAHLWWWE